MCNTYYCEGLVQCKHNIQSSVGSVFFTDWHCCVFFSFSFLLSFCIFLFSFFSYYILFFFSSSFSSRCFHRVTTAAQRFNWECATGVPRARIKRVCMIWCVCRLTKKTVLRKAFDIAVFISARSPLFLSLFSFFSLSFIFKLFSRVINIHCECALPFCSPPPYFEYVHSSSIFLCFFLFVTAKKRNRWIRNKNRKIYMSTESNNNIEQNKRKKTVAVEAARRRLRQQRWRRRHSERKRNSKIYYDGIERASSRVHTLYFIVIIAVFPFSLWVSISRYRDCLVCLEWNIETEVNEAQATRHAG